MFFRCRLSAVLRWHTKTGVWSRSERELGSDPQSGASLPLRSTGKGKPFFFGKVGYRAVVRGLVESSARPMVEVLYWVMDRRKNNEYNLLGLCLQVLVKRKHSARGCFCFCRS